MVGTENLHFPERQNSEFSPKRGPTRSRGRVSHLGAALCGDVRLFALRSDMIRRQFLQLLGAIGLLPASLIHSPTKVVPSAISYLANIWNHSMRGKSVRDLPTIMMVSPELFAQLKDEYGKLPVIHPESERSLNTSTPFLFFKGARLHPGQGLRGIDVSMGGRRA